MGEKDTGGLIENTVSRYPKEVSYFLKKTKQNIVKPDLLVLLHCFGLFLQIFGNDGIQFFYDPAFK
jgi:hypothetical protein